MVVYFSASSRNINKDIDTYRRIISTVRGLGHSIGHDWVETALLMKRDKAGSVQEWDLPAIVTEAEIGIDVAEVVIVEATDISTFGVGYEMALALQRRKPVLALVRKDCEISSYAAALTHDFLTVGLYDDASLEQIVGDFLQENTILTKDLRFNFVIDRQLYNYLRAKAFKTRKTKAELVRDLLIDDMRSGK